MGSMTKLKNILKEMGSVAVAFSGGADSAFLLYVANETPGVSVIAVTARSAAIPEKEILFAGEFCNRYGIRHKIFDSNEQDMMQYKKNVRERCYYCKKAILEKVLEIAEEEGVQYPVEGSNTDDAGDYRPGIKAVREMGVRSPLREAGFSKSDIREESRKLGLLTWNKPSFSCLATRIPYGEVITLQKLKMIDTAETLLKDMGFTQVRVRLHDKMVRIEVLPEEIKLFTESNIRKKIVSDFKKLGFTYISLDLEGYRTGSMNEVL